jgi:hypothetical protein
LENVGNAINADNADNAINAINAINANNALVTGKGVNNGGQFFDMGE